MITKLKGTVKRVHQKTRAGIQPFVVGVYDLSLEIFKEAAEIAPSRKAKVLGLLWAYNYLDGYSEVRISLGHALLSFDPSH